MAYHHTKFVQCPRCGKTTVEGVGRCYHCNGIIGGPPPVVDPGDARLLVENSTEKEIAVRKSEAAPKRSFSIKFSKSKQGEKLNDQQPLIEGNGASAQNTPEVKKLGVYPFRVDGHQLQYHYVFEFVPISGVDVFRDVLQGEEKIVSVSPEGEYINLIHGDLVFGTIHNAHKAEMLSDWNRKNLPSNAILLASGNKVNLRFYEDRRIKNAWREQDVFALTSYRNEDAQDWIVQLSAGEQLEFEEDFDDDHPSVLVQTCGQTIGKFPKKYAEKAVENDIVLLVVESIEEEWTDEGDSYDKPIVRVYW